MALSRRGGFQVHRYNTRSAELRREKKDWISRVPDEVLEQIFLEDVLDKQDLQCVARVSRRFSILVRTSLYSHVTIVPRGNLYKRFKRLLHRHPEVAFYVWGATLLPGRLGEFDGNLSDKPFSLARNEFVGLLPALRSLKLGPYLCSTELLGLLDHPTSQLRHLSFDCGINMDSIQIATMAMALPQIKKLSLFLIRSRNDVSLDVSSRDCLLGTSQLKELTLDGVWWGTGWVIQKTDLLKIPRALEKFSFSYNWLYRWPTFPGLEPGMMINALRPLYSTLTFLDLQVIGRRTGIRGSIADLSCFVSLKSLAVYASLVFRGWPWGLFDESCGLYNQLPYTLETLKIFFNSDDEYMEESGTGPPRAPYGWLLELAEYKSVKFPCLKEVSLVSDESALSRFSISKYWEDSVLGVLKTAGIFLYVTGI